MTLWGIHFFVNWKRHEKSLNLLWNDYANQDNKITHPRKEFKGTLIISQITDKEDHQFTTQQRFPRYVLSFLICTPCLVLALIVIIAFLNASGVIRPDHHGGAFDMPMLSALANEGAIFDPEASLCMFVGIA